MIFKKINIYVMFTFLLAFFSFSTLTYRFWPAINIILGFFIFGILILIYFDSLKKKDIAILLPIILISVLSLRYMENISTNIGDALRWIITLMLLWKICDKDFSSKIFLSCKKISRVLNCISLINILIIAVGLFLDICYSHSWEGRYYICFAYSEHSFCCSALISFVLVLISAEKNKRYLIKIPCFLILSFSIFQSGARTYIISIIILWLFVFKYYIQNKKLKYYLIPLFMVLFVFFIVNSNIMEKIIFTYNNQYISNDTSTSISSGRFDFWKIDLHAFSELNLFDQLFGTSFDYVYIVNLNNYGLEIWAHNDFINVLLCNGIFGLFIYVVVLMRTIFVMFKNKVKHFDAILVFMFYLIVAFINGLFGYQHYLYCYVLLYCFIDNYSYIGITVEDITFEKMSDLSSSSASLQI